MTVSPIERSAKTTKTLVVLIMLLGVVCCLPSLAWAEFGRPFIGQLTSTPTGPSGEAVPFGVEGGITTDAEDKVYVGNGADVEEFGSSGSFVRQISSPEFPASLAFDDESGKLETGAGGHGGGDVWVATDDSTGPNAGAVYFATDFPGGASVRRMNKNGEPEDFTCTAENAKEYVEGNELVGRSGEKWEQGNLDGVAIDSGNGASAGYIYAIEDSIAASGGIQVDQFTPAGCFVRAFTAALVPEANAFEGASLRGVAVDPTTGDVLIEAEDDDNQVIDEFTYTGEYLGKIAGVSIKDGFEHSALTVSGSALAVSSTGDLYVLVGEEVVPSGNSLAAKKTVIDEFGNSAFYPAVVTGGIAGAGSGGATLTGVVNGEGRGLEECKFQYVSEPAFDADNVDAVETVTLAGATGTGDLSAAAGTGDLTAGSQSVTGVVTSAGAFAVGQQITGAGIPGGATVVAVGSETLELSVGATESGTAVGLSAGSEEVTSVHTATGAFVVGEKVSGVGVPAGSAITAVGSGVLSLSQVADVAGVGVALTAKPTGGSFSLALDGVSTGGNGEGNLVGPAKGSGEVFAGVNVVFGPSASSGVFVSGEELSGAGIPSGTTIEAVEPGFLVLSANASGSGVVSLSAASNRVTGVHTTSGAFGVGEEISGAGIPAGTTITEVEGATIALSADVTASGSGVALSSAIPYDASAGQVQAALEGLRAIGAGDVKVSGSEGGPYTIEFTGALAHTRVAQLTGDASGLTPGGSSVSVAVEAVGGDGWADAGEASCEPGAGALKTEDENQPVHAKIGGLSSGSVYLDRLIAATDQSERGGVFEGAVVSFEAPDDPLVEGVRASGVSSSFATLHAVIDPRGSDTSYRLIYSDVAGTGGATQAVDLGGGARGVSVEQQVSGLSPGTAYRFWVVATNGVGEVSGEGTPSGEGAFSTAPSSPPVLPDGRAYELVTPANKGDAEDLFAAGQNFDSGYSSEDGERFILFTAVAFGPFPDSGKNAYVFSRGSDGWSYRSVASPGLGVQSETSIVYDPFDLSLVGITEIVGYHGEVAGSKEQRMGLYGPPSGPYTTVASNETSELSEHIRFVGGSSDLGMVVLESADHGLPVCEGGAAQTLAETLDQRSAGLYEWAATRGCLSLLDVRSSAEGGGLVSQCGAALGQGQDQAFAGVSHSAVSKDGSRVVFTAPDPEGSGLRCWQEHGSETENPPQLYMRDGEAIVEVSAREPGGSQNYPAVFVGASEDDSKVFFLTRSELTKEARELKTVEPELYECEIVEEAGKAKCRLTRVSRPVSGKGEGKVLDVPTISADGSTVYFNAEGEVTPGAKGGLYRYDSDTRETTRVAPLQSYPVETPGTGRWYNHQTKYAEVAGLDAEANWYATRDGQFLVFPSTEELTGYDSSGQQELYRYDSVGGSIVCVSCNPNGAAPSSGGKFASEFTRSVDNANNPAGAAPRAISENGEYVFFDTAESLVPQDTNGVIDVYEWHDGTISSISTGQSSTNDYFLDSSAYVNAAGETVEAGNVFFGTHARLVSQDTDSSGDLYDARIAGGFGTSAGSAPCEGDACQSPPALPLFQSPATSTLASSGNLVSEPPPPAKIVAKTVKCKKPKKPSHGKCIKPKNKARARKASHSGRAKR